MSSKTERGSGPSGFQEKKLRLNLNQTQKSQFFRSIKLELFLAFMSMVTRALMSLRQFFMASDVAVAEPRLEFSH